MKMNNPEYLRARKILLKELYVEPCSFTHLGAIAIVNHIEKNLFLRVLNELAKPYVHNGEDYWKIKF